MHHPPVRRAPACARLGGWEVGTAFGGMFSHGRLGGSRIKTRPSTVRNSAPTGTYRVEGREGAPFSLFFIQSGRFWGSSAPGAERLEFSHLELPKNAFLPPSPGAFENLLANLDRGTLKGGCVGFGLPWTFLLWTTGWDDRGGRFSPFVWDFSEGSQVKGVSVGLSTNSNSKS